MRLLFSKLTPTDVISKRSFNRTLPDRTPKTVYIAGVLTGLQVGGRPAAWKRVGARLELSTIGRHVLGLASLKLEQGTVAFDVELLYIKIF